MVFSGSPVRAEATERHRGSEDERGSPQGDRSSIRPSRGPRCLERPEPIPEFLPVLLHTVLDQVRTVRGPLGVTIDAIYELRNSVTYLFLHL